MKKFSEYMFESRAKMGNRKDSDKWIKKFFAASSEGSERRHVIDDACSALLGMAMQDSARQKNLLVKKMTEAGPDKAMNVFQKFVRDLKSGVYKTAP